MADESLPGAENRLKDLEKAVAFLREAEERMIVIQAQLRKIQAIVTMLENLGFLKGGEKNAEVDD